MHKNNRRYMVYFGAAILVFALVFGAGATMWLGDGETWAAQTAQETNTQLVEHLS